MDDYRSESPEILRRFLIYHETIKGHSKKTVNEYFLDLRTFFRFLKLEKGLVPRDTPMEQISIMDVDIEFVRSVTLTDVYSFLAYLSRDREISARAHNKEYGLNAASRSRKVSSIRSFYKFLTVKDKSLDINPVQDLDSPKIQRTLPRYLSVDEAENLLSNVDGHNQERDYCILTIFLNCGLRISEVAGINISDIHSDSILVHGKGGKDRVVYLNDACVSAINDYLVIRKDIASLDRNAFFLSSRRQRISKSAIHALVKKHLEAAGIDSTLYSSHKLRHTAATLMLHNGVDVRTLQELLGHENLNTTEIYTHVESTGLREAAQLSPLADFVPQNRKKESGTKD